MTLRRAVLGALLLAAVVHAAGDPVKWTATVEPATAHPGEVATLVLHAAIDDGWHIYSVAQPPGGPTPTSLHTEPTAALEALGGPREPAPETHLDEGFHMQVATHRGQIDLRQPFRVADTASGALTIAGSLKYQACTDTSCLPPATFKLTAPLTVEAGAVRAEYRDAPPEAVTTPATPVAAPAALAMSAADEARSRGLGAFLLVAFLAGLAALLTPCVFPMVPITVSFFTKQAGDSPRQRVSLALFYGLGIMLMYTGLGLVLSAAMGPAGAQKVAANPWLNLFFAALFLFFAVSLFGYFELALPSGLINRTSRLGRSGGYLGALFMGLTLTLAAFTCTVQFVGGVLVWAAQGERLWPILGMLTFSLAFALPFVLLALFPQWLATLPKSGGWLHDTKVVLGFVEVAAACKFLSNADLVWQWRVLSRELVLGIWAATAFLCAVYLAGRLRLAGGETPDRVGRGRQWGAVLSLAVCAYFAWGLSGAKLEENLESLLPPLGYGRGTAKQADTKWITDYQTGLEAARQAGGAAFVDFTGVTCTNCRWMEENCFPQPEIAQRLARFTLVRLYTDEGARADEYRQLETTRYNTASLPFYAIVTPDGQTLATFDGLTRDASKFQAFLDEGLKRMPSGS